MASITNGQGGFDDKIMQTVTDYAKENISIPANKYSPQDILLQAYEELAAAKETDNLSPKGEKILSLFKDGAITPGAYGAYAKGLTSNLSDEIIGFFRSTFGNEAQELADYAMSADPYGSQQEVSPYEAARAIERIDQKEYAEAFPNKALGYEVLGGVTQAFIPGMQPKTLMQGVSQGAKYSGLSAFGESEGSAGTQGIDTATGVGVGGVIAGGLGLGGRVLKKGYDVLTATPDKVLRQQTDKILKETLENDFGSIEEALAEVSKRAGKPIVLADLGTNSRAMLDAANLIPTPSKKAAQLFLEGRNKGMTVRLTSDIQEAFGKKGAFYDEWNALRVAKADRAGKLYTPALKIKVPITEDLNILLKRPSIQKGYERAMNLVKEGKLDDPGIRLSPDGKLFVAKADGSTGKLPAQVVPTDFLHTIKMGLDENLGDASRASMFGGGQATGIDASSLGAMRDTKNAFLRFIDSKNSKYKLARDFYAGDMAIMNAMDEGKKIFTKQFMEEPAMVAKSIIKPMNFSEKEAFRSGVMSQVMSKIGGAVDDPAIIQNRNVAKQFLSNPKQLAVLRETFPEGTKGQAQFKKFIENFKQEVDMFETSQILGGSQTAGRQATLETLFASIKETVPSANMSDTLIKIINEDLQNLSTEQKRLIAGRVIDTLAEANPKEIKKILTRLNQKGVGDYIKKAFGYAQTKLTDPRVLMQQPGQLSTGILSQDGYLPTR